MHLSLLIVATSLTAFLPLWFSYQILLLFDTLQYLTPEKARAEFLRLASLQYYHHILSLFYLSAVIQFMVFSETSLQWNQLSLSLLIVAYPMYYMWSLLREKFTLVEREFPRLRSKKLSDSFREIGREFFQGEDLLMEENLEIFDRGAGFPLEKFREYLSGLSVERGTLLEEGHRLLMAYEWISQKARVVRDYHNLFDTSPSVKEEEEEGKKK